MVSTLLVLECSDCGSHATTLEEAEEHEIACSTPDEPHGGWDTMRVPAPQDSRAESPTRVNGRNDMIKAEAVLLGATFADPEGNTVYTVESVRIDKGVRLEFDLGGERQIEKGAVSLFVRYAADGGTDIRRFSLGQDVPLTNPDGSTEPLV